MSNAKDIAFLGIAQILGELSTCDRAPVGAIITRDGRAISWGYNGSPPGMPHCQYTHEPEDCKAVHAEANAIAFAARQGISTEGSTLYVSLSPCLVCARLVIAAGIIRVVWAETYRDPRGSTLLEQAGVEKEVILPDYGL